MDYPNYAPHPSQPYSTLYGLPTPDQPPQPPSEDALHDPFALVRTYPLTATSIAQISLSNKSLQNGAYNQYCPGFDPSFRLDPSSSFIPPHSPPDSFTKQSVSSNDVHNSTRPGPTSIDGDEGPYRDPTGRSSSEEKDSATPAQSKRKAQNRAAYVISVFPHWWSATSSALSTCMKGPPLSFAKRNANASTLTASEHSASEKSAMSETSKTK